MQFKVFTELEELVASFADADHAASFVAILGHGATIRYGRGQKIVWREGFETVSAHESYDEAAEIMYTRIG